MLRIIIGATIVALAGITAAIIFWVALPGEAPFDSTAEAAVAEACATLDATDSFDSHIRLRTRETKYGVIEFVSDVQFSGDLKRTLGVAKVGGKQEGPVVEEIMDMANKKRYWRNVGDSEWKTADVVRESEFPYTKESLCPDLTDASVTFVGDDTVNGVATRKYSYESKTKLLDWYFWVDSSGWLVQIESTKLDPPGATGQSAEDELGIYATATLSGRGEPNIIEVPQVSR